MLMSPKTAASKAGVVYMLSCRSRNFTVTPFSPMKDRHACKAEAHKHRDKHEHVFLLQSYSPHPEQLHMKHLVQG